MIFKGIHRVFQRCFKEISRKISMCFKKCFMLHGTHRSFPSRRRACSCIKEVDEKHLIWHVHCQYMFLDVCPKGSPAVNMFSISKMSEIDPRERGAQHFSNVSEIQNFNIFQVGRGVSSQIGNFSRIFLFFLVKPSLRKGLIKRLMEISYKVRIPPPTLNGKNNNYYICHKTNSVRNE